MVTPDRRIDNLRRIAADPSVNNFARSICGEAADYLELDSRGRRPSPAGALADVSPSQQHETQTHGAPSVVAVAGTPRVNAVAPVDAFVTDSDHWAVSKTDYDCLLDLAKQLELESWGWQLAAGVASLERGEWAVEREDLLARLNAMAEHGNTLIGALAGQNIDLREKRKS